MPNIYELDVSAANNASTGGQNWAEGQSPGTVNNSARQLNALIAQFLADIGGDLEAGGTANALTVTANSDFTAYADGRIIAFKASADNTAATTLSVNGIGAKAIRKMTSEGEAAIDAGDIVNGYTYVVRYSETANSAAGAWLLDWAPKEELDATLAAIAALTTAADQTIYATGVDTFAMTALTAFARTLLDDANAAAAQATLGVPPNARTITAGTGMTGGGDLSANRTLSVDSTVWRDGNAPSATQLNEVTADSTVGTVGTYAFLRREGVTLPGETVAGSALTYTNAGGDTGGVSASGTWRCMGFTQNGSNDQRATLWLRIS